MPPPTMSEVMSIPTQAGNFGTSINGLAEYLARQQQAKQEYAQKLDFMHAQAQQSLADQVAAHKQMLGLDAQDPMHIAQLQQAQQNVGQNGQMPMSMQWQAKNQGAQQKAEQDRMIATEKAKIDYEDQIRNKRLEQAKQMFPEMFGGNQPQQQFTSQSNFNPIMGQSSPVFKGQNTSIGGINFNPMNPVAPQGQQQSGGAQESSGGIDKNVWQANPNYFTGGSNEMFARKPDNSYRDIALAEKQSQFNQRAYNKILEKNNPSVASPRSTLGMAANGNLRAARALETIQNDPVFTYQDLGNVVGDLAGIYQGGAPTDMGMKHQQYETLQTNIQNLKQFLTGKPQEAIPPEIKQKLVFTIKKLRKVNDAAIKANFDTVEAGNKKLLENYSDEWAEFRKRAEDQAGIFGDTQQGNTQTTSGKDYSSLWK